MKLIRLSSQLTFSCSKSQYKNQKKSWNIFKVKKKHQNDANDVVLMYFLLTWTYFTPFSSVSIGNFEQVNVRLVKPTFSTSLYKTSDS